jgi:hypothetical protein
MKIGFTSRNSISLPCVVSMHTGWNMNLISSYHMCVIYSVCSMTCGRYKLLSWSQAKVNLQSMGTVRGTDHWRRQSLNCTAFWMARAHTHTHTHTHIHTQWCSVLWLLQITSNDFYIQNINPKSVSCINIYNTYQYIQYVSIHIRNFTALNIFCL